MKLRQVALAAAELEPARSTLFELLGIHTDYADPGVGEFGLINSVMAIGDTFLEIVAPSETNTAAGRLVERRGETCGYMLLMQVESYADFAAHLDTQNARKVWEMDRAEVSACHVHPKDIGAAIVSFDEMRPPESWLWAGPDWTQNRATNVQRIVGCEVQTANLASLAQRWGDIMQTSSQTHGTGLRLAFSDGTFIDFVEGETYEGISCVTFATADPEAMYARATALGLGTTEYGNAVAMGGLSLRFVN